MNRLYIILAGILLVSGCEKALDTKVTWQIGDEDVWRVPELAMGVLHKAYNGISNRPDCYAENFLDAATDNAVCTQHSASVYKLGQGAMTSFNNPIGNWSTCYNMLEYVNSFLENGLSDNVLYNREDPDKDAQIKDRLRGEAYFLRAWWHFELLRMYGGKSADGKALGVPVADHYISYEEASENGMFIRPSYQATVDFICNDLDLAMELLPASYSGSDQNFGDTQIGRATSGAAAVLKSRVLLYSASPAMQDDDIVKITGMGTYEVVNPGIYQKKWELVAKQIARILTMEGFGTYVPLLPSDIADAQSESSDFAFRRYFNNNLLEANHFPPYYFGKSMTVPSHNLVKAFCAKNGFPVTDPRSGVDISGPAFDMSRLYSVMDDRFSRVIYSQGSVFGNSGTALDMSEGGRDSHGYNENATTTGYYLAKFVSTVSGMLNPVASAGSAHYNPLLRKSEVLLNYAEASNEAYGPKAVGEGSSVSAYDIIKSIRSLAGGIMSDAWLDECAGGKDTFRALIQNERRLEFAFENHRYFDMRRWLLPLDEDVCGVEITRNEDNTFSYREKVVEPRKYTVRDYYAPLPYAEISKNPNLVNNTGW
ncbi:MAG: RagB/SusD family nutrient uptake outer membrane protein [Bacteroidetes bacterium]|uniref:RagB/SusD family nutrient uptake outer membrane protein n=1 Tax=Candidatus Cryptobacteroides avicola TaxID=2840757 RepID=A0A940DSP5_9BACT|nr:RagB/SusD family nutrient uptake outer membrane protein [Candidatus Cryptobacteroides avicola]